MMNEIKVYLGDGVYVKQGRFAGEIILTTEDGINVQNQIFMEPQVLKAFDLFRESLKQIKDK